MFCFCVFVKQQYFEMLIWFGHCVLEWSAKFKMISRQNKSHSQIHSHARIKARGISTSKVQFTSQTEKFQLRRRLVAHRPRTARRAFQIVCGGRTGTGNISR